MFEFFKDRPIRRGPSAFNRNWIVVRHPTTGRLKAFYSDHCKYEGKALRKIRAMHGVGRPLRKS